MRETDSKVDQASERKAIAPIQKRFQKERYGFAVSNPISSGRSYLSLLSFDLLMEERCV